MSKRSMIVAKIQSNVQRFLSMESSSGIVLAVAAVLANLIVNSEWSPGFSHFLELEVGPMSVLHWINDGLMAVFFLNVWMEI
jgi:NhaA family Na+:H+ antiporter